MICQLCQKNEATIHLTEIVDNASVEVHVCEGCAKKENLEHDDAYSVADLMLNSDERDSTDENKNLTCDVCGWTFEDFKREGKFGCPNDYQVFASEIAPLLKRIHHATKHVGKNPHAERHAEISDLEKLRNQLELAIAAERYEEAAVLRDKMRAL